MTLSDIDFHKSSNLRLEVTLRCICA